MLTDLQIAKKYIGKADRARSDGHEFTISFTSFRNMMRAKKCKYTNTPLTEPSKSGGNPRFSDRTVDRIDNSKGYVSGNVVACSHGANRYKSILENPNTELTPQMAIKIANVTLKARKGKK